MKVQYLLCLIISFIYLSKCQNNIITPTNYTLSDFRNKDTVEKICKSNNECNFLCPGIKIDGPFGKPEFFNKFCVQVDSSIWDLNNEEYKQQKFNNTKPILKTCSDFNIECSTEYCKENSECVSGYCKSNVCVNSKIIEIYRCSSNNGLMKCGKVNNM